MKTIKIDQSQINQWANKTTYDEFGEMIEHAKQGKDIYFKCNAGAKTGSIGKVINPEVAFTEHQYSGRFMSRNGFQVDYGNGKIFKVAVKSYHNNFTFLLDYTGDPVYTFTKGTPKSKVTETRKPDLLGNTIRVGDWVIFQAKRRGHGEAAGLGKLTRLSDAGNAWVVSPGKYGDKEIQTESASSLIKIHMTDELMTTYALCDSLWALKTKLVMDLDIGNFEEDEEAEEEAEVE